jgi:hypothetical protein
MSNTLPDGFFGWVLTGVAAVIGSLVATVTTLWRMNEAKNTLAIESQAKQIARIEGQMLVVQEQAAKSEAARIECEKDRAVLATKCAVFESRLSEVEHKTCEARDGQPCYKLPKITQADSKPDTPA